MYKIIGLEQFTSKSGSQITKIHSVYKQDNNIRLSGTGVESFLIMTENVPADTCLDCYFIPLYGRQGSKGFLQSIQIVDKK